MEEIGGGEKGSFGYEIQANGGSTGSFGDGYSTMNPSRTGYKDADPATRAWLRRPADVLPPRRRRVRLQIEAASGADRGDSG